MVRRFEPPSTAGTEIQDCIERLRAGNRGVHHPAESDAIAADSAHRFVDEDVIVINLEAVRDRIFPALPDLIGCGELVPAVIEKIDSFIESSADDANAFLRIRLFAKVIATEPDE
jgi:hypothetical protein